MLHSILFFLLLLSGLQVARLRAQRLPIPYRASDENFPNPARGFYYQTAYRPQGGREPAPLNAVTLRKWRDSGISLIEMLDDSLGARVRFA